jgi:putative component of membrane protein insertase Oxa1/YidC/SpoIIIJ protein YidD
MRAIHLTNLTVLDWITTTISGEDYKLWLSLLRNLCNFAPLCKYYYLECPREIGKRLSLVSQYKSILRTYPKLHFVIFRFFSLLMSYKLQCKLRSLGPYF